MSSVRSRPERPARKNFDEYAEDDGFEAYVMGDGIEQNPFSAGGALHEAWRQGWLNAKAYHGR
jgi:hypothetical protein